MLFSQIDFCSSVIVSLNVSQSTKYMCCSVTKRNLYSIIALQEGHANNEKQLMMKKKRIVAAVFEQHNIKLWLNSLPGSFKFAIFMISIRLLS